MHSSIIQLDFGNKTVKKTIKPDDFFQDGITPFWCDYITEIKGNALLFDAIKYFEDIGFNVDKVKNSVIFTRSSLESVIEQFYKRFITLVSRLKKDKKANFYSYNSLLPFLANESLNGRNYGYRFAMDDGFTFNDLEFYRNTYQTLLDKDLDSIEMRILKVLDYHN